MKETISPESDSETFPTVDRSPTDQPAAVVVLTGPQAGQTVVVGAQAIIGRGDACQLRVEGDRISREHLRITRLVSDMYELVDLDSRNGTSVNDRPWSRGPIHFGDRINLGGDALLLFTPHDQLHEELLEKQRMESIGLLAGGVAHDFNNFIMAVLGNVSVLLDPTFEVDEAEARTMLEDVQSAAVRSAELTRHLLNLCHRSRHEPTEVSLGTLIGEVSRFCGRTFGPSVDIEVDCDADIHVLGDSALLNQVLMNLFMNARDAMPAGGRIGVSVSLRDDGPDAPLAILRVRDEGEGMSREVQDRIFEPFFTTKALGRGTGLGLANVRSVVERHGGQVRVESEPGQGTTFEIEMLSVPRGRASATRSDRDALVPVSRGKVLVIEDDELSLRSMQRCLDQTGYSELHCLTAEAGIEVFKAEHDTIQAVVLDWVMPDRTGPKTVQALRALEPDIPILIVSGLGDDDLHSLVAQHDRISFLAKPFDSAELDSRICELVTRQPSVPPEAVPEQ